MSYRPSTPANSSRSGADPRRYARAISRLLIGSTSQRGSFRIRIFQKRGRKLVRRAAIRGSGISAGPHSLAFNGRFHGRSLGPGSFVAIANGSARGAPTRRTTFKIRTP